MCQYPAPPTPDAAPSQDLSALPTLGYRPSFVFRVSGMRDNLADESLARAAPRRFRQ